MALTCLHGQVTVELVQHSHGHILVLGLAELQGTDRDRDTRQQCQGTEGLQLQTAQSTALQSGSVLHLQLQPNPLSRGTFQAPGTPCILCKSLPSGTG